MLSSQSTRLFPQRAIRKRDNYRGGELFNICKQIPILLSTKLATFTFKHFSGVVDTKEWYMGKLQKYPTSPKYLKKKKVLFPSLSSSVSVQKLLVNRKDMSL